jgi:hypothetical protein
MVATDRTHSIPASMMRTTKNASGNTIERVDTIIYTPVVNSVVDDDELLSWNLWTQHYYVGPQLSDLLSRFLRFGHKKHGLLA